MSRNDHDPGPMPHDARPAWIGLATDGPLLTLEGLDGTDTTPITRVVADARPADEFTKR